MLSHYYKKTPLEHWISQRYRSKLILNPTDIDIEKIATAFNIDLQFAYCRSFSDNEERVIFLDIRESLTYKRAAFFHELCHVLRHAGDQRKMTKLFRDAQEAEANVFTLYASMPFFMIAKMKLPERQTEAIEYLSEEFSVPFELALKRVEQINRRILQGQLESVIKEALQNNKFSNNYISQI